MDVAGGSVKKFFRENEQATWIELEQVQKINESSYCRNVGLVIETRPDFITKKELMKIRRLGATKVQIGVQSLSDSVLKMNKRGHDSKKTKNAFALLRLGGFKIHAHWMPNLYGSNITKDIQDYKRLWKKSFCPDELKIYPTSIIKNTDLYELYQEKKYRPYSQKELVQILISTIPKTPRYARLTRIIRDIPSTNIEAGNKTTNLRQIVEQKIHQQGKKLTDIRSREIKLRNVKIEHIDLEIIQYKTSVGTEYFLSYLTKKDDKIIGFLRLFHPIKSLSKKNYFKELQNCAIIREVHVYGQVVGIGNYLPGRVQHLGLGTKLIQKACELSKNKNWRKIAVISAIGTREYYRKRGFYDEGLYVIKKL